MPKTKAPKKMITNAPKKAATLGPGETYSPTTSAPSKTSKDAAATLGPGESYSPTTSSAPTKDPRGKRRANKTSNKTPSLDSALV